VRRPAVHATTTHSIAFFLLRRLSAFPKQTHRVFSKSLQRTPKRADQRSLGGTGHVALRRRTEVTRTCIAVPAMQRRRLADVQGAGHTRRARHPWSLRTRAPPRARSLALCDVTLCRTLARFLARGRRVRRGQRQKRSGNAAKRDPKDRRPSGCSGIDSLCLFTLFYLGI
jgi:hypothetical protein